MVGSQQCQIRVTLSHTWPELSRVDSHGVTPGIVKQLADMYGI